QDMRASLMAVSLLGLAALGGRAEAAQDLDSPKADPAHHKVEFENDQVRVVRWRIPPHEKTALHDHPALVSVLLTDADLKLTGQDGKVTAVKAKAGTAGWRGPTVHVAENVGDRPVEGILVEPKGPGNPAWTPPPNDATRLTPHDKVEFENDRVRIIRYVYGKGESSPMHDHPAGVQIPLTDSHARQTTPDGKTSELSGKAGTARYRPPLSHAITNLGERFEGLIVDLKGAPAR
ncbi:MAG TPA: hypothetical protein VFM45_08515, partial [Anaeromyxobacteraceae bacterium]|nr:hypothetical protein [Anaeromyxobacteraceae bacterium]